MDRFKQLETFLAVVDAGSFVGAAEHLRASKAAVSRCVQELEERVGARLIHRTTRKLSLTDAGREYYERGKQILSELDEADAAMGLATRQAVGSLRVNVPLTFGVRHLAHLWADFLHANPAVELDISLTDRVVDLVEEGVDVAVRIGQLPDTSLVARRLASTRLVACASPAYLARWGAPETVEALAQHRTIGYSYWSLGDTWRFESARGPVSVLTRPVLRSNNGDTCVALALAGQGIVMQPTFMLAECLREGALVEVLPDFRGPEVGVYAIYPSRKHLSAKVRALVDFLEEALRDAPWQSSPPAALA